MRRLEPRQRRHLRARFDLEDADGVGLAAACGRPPDRPAADARDRAARGRARSRLADVRGALRRRGSACRGRGRHSPASSASCSTAIMPRPSRSTLTIPMSAQSSLSHWTTTRPGMLAFSSGTHGIELPLADHHAAGMLAEMARQILHLAPQPREQPDARRRSDRGRPPTAAAAASRPDR